MNRGNRLAKKLVVAGLSIVTLGTILSGPSGTAWLAAQEAPAANATLDDELDRWRGSSIGILVERKDGSLFVEEVRDHVSDASPFQSGDRIVSVDGRLLSAEDLETLGDILRDTAPGTTLRFVVERDAEEVDLECQTLRQQLVDVSAIVERLRSNRIIKSRLQDTGKEKFLDEVSERMVTAVQSSASPREAAEAINAIIDEIDVSHTAIIPPQSFSQLTGSEAGDTGLTLRRHEVDGENRYFVIDRMPGSVGYASEILLGDEILELNGVPMEKSRRLILSGQEHRRQVFFIQSNLGDEIEITFRRRQNARPRTLTLVAARAVPALKVLHHSARVIESGKNRYGYVRFWNLMSVKTTGVTREIVEEQFADCDMLIFDLRGRGGLIPVVLSLEKLVRQTDVPVIAITDDLTRSAKEMLSLLIKKLPHVTVVGQKTAGAVTGATMSKLPSGYGFMYPALSSEALKKFTGDVVLEGVGVEPDILFDFRIPYCGGNDRLLEAAIETADDQIREFLDTIIW